MMRLHSLSVSILWAFFLLSPVIATHAAADSKARLKIMSWNIANLHHESGIPLRHRATARLDQDYEALAAIAAELDADIALLQEVGSLRALERIFPATDYHLSISARYTAGDEAKPADQRDIYTAIALSKSRFPTPPPVYTEPAFSILHFDYHAKTATASARPTRAAMAVELQLDPATGQWITEQSPQTQTFSILNIHLKSSCHQYSLNPIADQDKKSGTPYGSRFDCRTLRAQQLMLENWIELQQAQGNAIIIGGDFNRRLNRVFDNGNTDHFWQDLNDGEPNDLMLHKGPIGHDTQCWPKHKKRYSEHIDFFVFDDRVTSQFPHHTVEKRGLNHDDDPTYRGKRNQRLSDHCPVVFTLY